MNAANKRREKDIMKLMVSDFEVVMAEHPSNSFASEFFVKFQGPKDSPYEEVGNV
jgi:ubiquitin-protein ligase